MSTQAVHPATGNPEDRRPAAPSPLPPWLLPSVLGAAILLVFVLPLFVSFSPVRAISASWLAGFNNFVAVVGAASLSVAVLLFAAIRERHKATASREPSPAGRLGWRFVGVVVALSSAVLALAGTVVTMVHDRYLGDAGYVIEQASTWSETGRTLYSQIEFGYGPLLLLPEIWLSRLGHMDMTHAYFVILVLQSALGLCILAFLLNELPIRPNVRRVGLALFALGALTPHLGLNYTFFRFGSPLALLLFAAKRGRSPGVTAALLSAAIVLESAISPELSFALALGIAVYGGLRAWQDGRAWLLAGTVPLAVFAALLLTVGHDYLRMVSSFSHGVYNLPVGPYPHILILLFALVWLVPVYLGRNVVFSSPGGAAMAGLYAVSIALLPAALGRCDPLHVFFNGVGIFLLSLAAASRLSTRACVVWVACFAFLVLWEQRVNDALFSWRTAYTVQRVLPHTPPALRPALIALTALPNRGVLPVLHQSPPTPDHVVNIATLEHFIGQDLVAVPFEIPPVMEDSLKASHHYRPLFHAFAVDMMDDNAERSTVAELAQSRWLLLPTVRHLSGYLQTPANIGPIQGMRMYFRQRNPPLFLPGGRIEAAVASDWTPVATLDCYTLYRRNTP